jgi:hypothetical protein
MKTSYLNSERISAESLRPSRTIRLLLMVLLFVLMPLVSFGQCPYPSGASSVGTYTFCVDNPSTNANTILTASVAAGKFALVDVVKGFSYTFAVGDVWSGGGDENRENLTLFNAADNINVGVAGYTIGQIGATINWTATLSGQIKVLLSKNCGTVGSGTGTITLTLNTLGNTQDSQTAFGTNTWVGHIYNSVTGASPEPFVNANYAGYYNIPSETITEGFGGDRGCFNVLSDGANRAKMYTETFAVRYRMKTTKAGCYIVNFRGDDGIRLTLNGQTVFNRWVEQSPTNYSNILIRLDGDDDFVLDFYENGGQNEVGFSLVPFDTNSNTITAPATINFCSNGDPAVIDGSLQYSSSTPDLQNPQLNFQWQLSTDGGAFTNIPGATTRTYDPPAIANTTSVNIVRRFKRLVTFNLANMPDINGVTTNCVYNESNIIAITTSPNRTPAQPNAITGTLAQCPALASQIYSVTAVTNATTYNWSVPTGWVITAGTGTNSITVTTGSTGQDGNISVTAQNDCGTSTARTLAVTSANMTVTASIPQTQCITQALTPNLTQTTSLATGISNSGISGANGLPAGVSAVWAANIITISGTPTASGTFNYSIPLTGGCGTVNATGTITVTPNRTASVASSAPTLCINTILTNITHTTTGATAIGTATGLPTGVTVVFGSNTITISGTPTASGTFNYSIPLTGGCGSVNATGTVTVTPASVGGTVSSSQTICSNTQPSDITLTGHTGSIQWQVSSDNSTFSAISGATTSTLTSIQMGELTTTRYYRAVLSSGVCSSAFSNVVTVTAVTSLTTTGVSICAGDSGLLTASGTCGSNSPVTTDATNAGKGTTSGGEKKWDDLKFLESDDDKYTDTEIKKKDSSENLSATNYGFSIPANATINGVQVIIGRKAERLNSLSDSKVYLRIGGIATGINKASNTKWTKDETAANYGSAADLWGTALTPAIINAADFGVVLDVNNSDKEDTRAYVDYIQIKVSYSIIGTLDWFTASSGGTSIGSGTSFNPVGVAGSGLTDTNTPGSTTYYVECSMNKGCRTSANFVINASPSIVSTSTQPNCKTPTGAVKVTSPSPAAGITYTVTGTNPIVAAVTNTTGVFSGLAAGNYNVTTTNGCTSSPTNVVIVPFVEITNTWNGSDWDKSNPPTAEQKLVFAGNYPPAVDPNVDIVGCSCLVTGKKTVTLKSGRTLTITNEVTVAGDAGGAGSLIFENNASLVQINNTAINKGDIEYQRSTNTVVRKTDYVYWSSPIINQRLGDLSSKTANGTFYFFDTGTEDWIQKFNDAIMDIGKGYIVRRPDFMSGVPVITETYTAYFDGQPNNGVITIPGGFTGAVEGTSNLLGNPYPSAIDADKFLAANAGVLDGTLYFWTHNTALNLAGNISNPGPGWAYTYSLDDYASYNITGGVGTAPDITASAPSDPNHSVKGVDLGKKPTGKIAAGQGFFATSKALGNVTFNNDMRLSSSGAILNNSQFFKTKNPNGKTANTIEKNRIWLNLTNTEGAFKQTLIGYVTDATNEYDSRFDGESFDANEYVDFYSVNQDKNLVIQGRALPFDENDEVPLGYRTTINGDFTINIDQVDGSLTNQTVFIEDKLTNTVTDLKNGNYTFNTAAGTFNERFVLKYTNKTLSVDAMDKEDGILVLYSNNYKTLIIHNNVMDSTVNSVTLYNITGQKISNWDVKDSEQTNIQIPIKNISSGIYIVKVNTTKGESSKKIIVN